MSLLENDEKSISIHAAQEGCDNGVKRYVTEVVGISIHAAQEGCDYVPVYVCALTKYFNPRSPRGLRHFQNNLCRRQNDFNPRSPRGLRQWQ